MMAMTTSSSISVKPRDRCVGATGGRGPRAEYLRNGIDEASPAGASQPARVANETVRT